MTTFITKDAAIQAFGNASELARAIGTTPQAIYQWPDGKPIPEGRQWQLRALYPALFPTDELPKQEAA